MKKDYVLIDSGHFQKLEQVGPYRLVRPSPQAVWSPRLSQDHWTKVDAKFDRFAGGDGKWSISNPSIPKRWTIKQGTLSLTIGLTDFGHLGIFPEQDSNWMTLEKLIAAKKSAEDFQVLNLFAYTGGSTLACAAAGAKVVHLDASKTSVQWARENAEASSFKDAPIRWIVDDVQKFVEREVRRGNKYHGIILDPPSFGRGAQNEVWKIEDHLVPLLKNLKSLLADSFTFVLLSCHSNGYTPMALKNLLQEMAGTTTGTFDAHEMVIAETNEGDLMPRVLPSGASCLFVRN